MEKSKNYGLPMCTKAYEEKNALNPNKGMF
jgi:hypothetical protein